MFIRLSRAHRALDGRLGRLFSSEPIHGLKRFFRFERNSLEHRRSSYWRGIQTWSFLLSSTIGFQSNVLGTQMFFCAFKRIGRRSGMKRLCNCGWYENLLSEPIWSCQPLPQTQHLFYLSTCGFSQIDRPAACAPVCGPSLFPVGHFWRHRWGPFGIIVGALFVLPPPRSPAMSLYGIYSLNMCFCSRGQIWFTL